MVTILAPYIPQLVGALASLVLAGIGWLTLTVKSKVKADSNWRRLAEFGVSLLGKAWDKLSPEIQTALADGQISTVERERINDVLLSILTDNDRALLEEIGKAVGLPFASIIARLAADMVNTWASAHDEANPLISAKAYPIGTASFAPNANPGMDSSGQIGGG